MRHTDDGMDEFEVALSAALREVSVPEGFAGRLMLRAAAERKVVAFPRRVWIGGVAASLLVAGLVLGGAEHRRAEERAKADRDFARSQEITERAMEVTREKVLRAGVVVD